MFRTTQIAFSLILLAQFSFGQQVPSGVENIDFLTTFGSDSQKNYGDDDFTQVFFFVVPFDNSLPVYIRIFDPETGGKNDLSNHGFNTTTHFAVYGGNGAFSNEASHDVNPSTGYTSGILMKEETFTSEPQYDNKWYTFGPFNPVEGEKSEKNNGYIFKIVISGKTGDDGNLYRMFLSSSAETNIPVEGGNAFTYEYSFRLKSESGTVTHLYPYIDEDVTSIEQHNFDFDGDGEFVLYSVSKNRHLSSTSGNGDWATDNHTIDPKERNTTLDFQILKKGNFDNDMVVYLVNQYNQPIPFFAIPIGGAPKFEYKVKVTKK